MRVGLVSAEFPPAVGGVGDHTARLAQELTRAGHEVDVLTSASPPWPETSGATVLRAVRTWDGRIWWQVPRIARRRGWDILHIQYQPAAYALHGAINLLPIAVGGTRPAVVTTFHDLRVPYLFPKAGPLRTAAVATLAKLSAAVIAVSDDDLPQLIRWRPAKPPETTRHVPLGDQLDDPLPEGFDAAVWRARLGLHRDTLLIAHFGLINASKGVLELVDALAHIDGAHLLMIGEALGASDATNRAYLDRVRARIAERHLDSRIHWTGRVTPSELAGWLMASDVVALPYSDGASLRRTSLITAWRRRRPVVTTTPAASAAWRGDAPLLAALVAPGDASELARALSELLTDETRRARLATAGAHFAERFAWPSVVRQTVDVYRVALSRGR
ncbi:MAG TPA: glycosyltransferase family 4 protein [Chloroflexota bacterium]|nr:glycosyltransferase family 4 protein [Chloroflexota bacterium]